MTKIAIVTCLVMPEPDVDEGLLLEAARVAGLDVELVAWDDPSVKWDRYALAVIRSTWNYYRAHAAFLAWTERAAASTRLCNGAATVAWNSDKSYLARLAQRGIAVVPTLEVARGSDEDLGALASARGWRAVVVKPRVSAGSFETYRYTVAELAGAELAGGELARHAEARDLLVQPFVESVAAYGERCLVWIDGELTHAVRKSPRFVGGGEQVLAVPIADDERAFALGLLDKLDDELLYARVDIARDESGAPMLMELELVEPSLFLRHHPSALARLVAAIARRAG